MSWTTPKRWTKEKWIVGDANTYIRDNFKNLREYVSGPHWFFDTVATSHTAPVTTTHSNILAAAPTNNYTLLIVLSLNYACGTLAANAAFRYCKCQLLDGSSNDISLNTNAEYFEQGLVGARSTYFRQIGKVNINAGTNATFKFLLGEPASSTGAGTCKVTSLAWILPQ